MKKKLKPLIKDKNFKDKLDKFSEFVNIIANAKVIKLPFFNIWIVRRK